MGILKKVFGGSEADQSERTDASAVEAAECPHTALTSHWDNAADMGKPEVATYTCDACGAAFSYAEAQQFLNQPPAVLLAAGRASDMYDDEATR